MKRLFFAVVLIGAPPLAAQDAENFYQQHSSDPQHLVAFKNMLYFTADDGRLGREIWRCNPANEKVELVSDVTPGAGDSEIDLLHATADTLWFRLRAESGEGELWASDGVPGGEPVCVWRREDSALRRGVDQILGEVSGGLVFTSGAAGENHTVLLCSATDRHVSPLVGVDGQTIYGEHVFGLLHGGELFFSGSDHTRGMVGLWRTDGSPHGTYFIREFKNYPTPAIYLEGVGLFVVAETEENGIELWLSQGDRESTRLVRDIYPGSESSRPADFCLDRSSPDGTPKAVYFAATHPETGRELWRSDGTAEGTVLAQDIDFGRDSSNPYRIYSSHAGIFLIASTAETGKELWAGSAGPDGYGQVALSGEGLVGPESSEPYSMCIGSDGGLFYAQRGPDGEEFWYASTHPGSARQLMDINPQGISEPFWPVQVGDHVFFSACDPVRGRELWVDRGGLYPPVQVADIKSDESVNPSSSPSELASLGERLLFAANDIKHGNELWTSDGTDQGTTMLKDIAVGSPSSNPSQITPIGSLAYFRAESLGYGVELWVTDGTPGGTVQVADIYPDEASSNPDHLIALGDSLLFMAQSPREGNELWILRPGKEPKTVKYICGGPGSTIARNFFVWKGFVYFQADDGVHGEELWRTDGTDAGTVMVKDIVGLPFEAMSVSEAHTVGDRLFVSADMAGTGQELWLWEDTSRGPRLVRDIASPTVLDVRALK